MSGLTSSASLGNLEPRSLHCGCVYVCPWCALALLTRRQQNECRKLTWWNDSIDGRGDATTAITASFGAELLEEIIKSEGGTENLSGQPP
jgi:hypothetical protein